MYTTADNVDKRGRKVNESSSEDLRKYYQLEGMFNNISVIMCIKPPIEPVVNEESDGEAPEEGETNEESDGEAPKGGEANEESDGEAPEEGETNETANEVCTLVVVIVIKTLQGQVIHDWGGVSEVVVDEKTSKRLAVCNMDWDRINANDIFGKCVLCVSLSHPYTHTHTHMHGVALAHSFKPSEGSVCRVTVYPSQFGRERLSQEELIGPVSAGDDGVVSQESLRRYQLDRLRLALS